MPARGLGGRYQGSKWLRREKRLAIYIRDGLACAWCGEGIEDEAKLSLDHIIPHNQGGANEAANLVTACSRCNSSRADRPVEEFAGAVATYLDHGIAATEIAEHVRQTVQRLIDVKAAKELIARRGSWAQVMSR